jgi:hypothetical protein
MSSKSDAQNVYQQINELGRQVSMPNLAGLLRAAGFTRQLDLAESAPYKPGDDLNYKPGDDLNYKPGDDLSRMFGSRGLGLADLPALAELANAVTAMAYARALVKDLRPMQEKLNGEDRALLQKSLNHLETQIDHIDASVRQAVAASVPARAASGSDGGRAVHVHLHLGS